MRKAALPIGLVVCAAVLAYVFNLARPDQTGDESNSGNSPRDPAAKLSAFPESETIDSQIRWILRESDHEVRYQLTSAYIDSLQPEEFPAAFKSYTQQLKHQRPQFLTYLLRVWAERDPHAAWEQVRPMFEITVPFLYTDTWEQPMIPPRNLVQLHRSDFWPTTRELRAFVESVPLSAIPESEKLELIAEFTGLYRDYFDPDYNPPKNDSPNNGIIEEEATPTPISAADYQLARTILETPIADVSGMIGQAAQSQNLPAFIFGLRRLIENDSIGIAESMELAGNYPDESERARYHVIASHAKADLETTWAWIAESIPDDLDGIAGAAMFPYLSEEQRDELVASSLEDEKPYDFHELMEAWAKIDLETALTTTLDLGNEENFSEVVARAANYRGGLPEMLEVIELLSSLDTQPHDYEVTEMMEYLGDWDVGASARFGAEWMMDSDEYSREHILDVWGGNRSPFDGATDDRTFGCLRCWALTEPEAMTTWIETLPDAAYRESLHRLMDHATGIGEP